MAHTPRTLAFSEALTFRRARSTLMREGAAAAGRGNPNPHPHLLPRLRSPPARARGARPAPSSLRANEPRNAALGGGGWGPGDRGVAGATRLCSCLSCAGCSAGATGLGTQEPFAPRPAPPGARRHAAREQAARPGPLLNRPGRRGPTPAEPLPPRPGADEQRPGTPSLPAAPPRHPPRAAGAHAAAKVSAGREPGGLGSDILGAPRTLAGATARFASSPPLRLILLRFGASRQLDCLSSWLL